MQLPEAAMQPNRANSALVDALARAFRWKRMVELGELATAEEMSERDGITSSYMTRILRLTLSYCQIWCFGIVRRRPDLGLMA